MTPTDLGLVYSLLFTHREIHGNPPDRHLRDGESEAARILSNCDQHDLNDLEEFLASQGFALYIRQGLDFGIPQKAGRPNTIYVITRKRGEPLARYLDKDWFIERIRDGRRKNAPKAELVVWLSRMWLTLQWFFYQKHDRLPSEISRYRDALVTLDLFTEALGQGVEHLANAGRPEGAEGVAWDHLWAGKKVVDGYARHFLNAMEEAGMVQGTGNPGEYRQTLVAAVDMEAIAQNELVYLMPPDDETAIGSRAVELIMGEAQNSEVAHAAYPEA